MTSAGTMKKCSLVATVAIGAALSCVAAANSGDPGSAVSVAAAASRPQDVRSITKIMIVVLENTNYDAALRQPFLKSLTHRGALLTHYSAVAHPSEPNYIALISGSTYGVASDANVTLDKPQIGDLLEAKGLTWKVYSEGYPGNCFLGAAAGNYVRKHVPFLSFKNVQDDPARCARIVDASELNSDVRDGKLPAYSLYIPDLKDDGHDTGVAYADRWLSATFGPFLQNPRFTRGMLFVVTFDEGRSFFGGNHVATVLVGDTVTPGAASGTDYNHYSLLRLVEDAFGLRSLGPGDAHAGVITGIWK
jgi:Phosphoesterase family